MLGKISVVMAVCNDESYLKESIESVLDQTYKNFELIIINDASTDTSEAILKTYPDTRIQVINNEVNIGLTKSLNKALQIASGEFVARMDADDICHKERFEKQVAFFNSNKNISLCGTWVTFFGKENNKAQYPVFHDEIKVALLSYNPFAHPTVMWRNRNFKESGFKYDEDYITSQDYELWSRAAYKIQTANIPEYLLFYRKHDRQITNYKQKDQSGNATKIKLNQLGNLHLAPVAEQIIAHQCLFDGMFKTYRDHRSVKRADDWMYEIYKANKKYNIYNEKILLEFWRSVFFKTCLYSYDLRIWSVLKTSWAWQLCNIPFSEKAKQFFKCLVNWNIK